MLVDSAKPGGRRCLQPGWSQKSAGLQPGGASAPRHFHLERSKGVPWIDIAVHHVGPPLVGNHTPLSSIVTSRMRDPGARAVAVEDVSEEDAMDPTSEADGPMLEGATEAPSEQAL